VEELAFWILEYQANLPGKIRHRVTAGILSQHNHITADNATSGLRNQTIQCHAQRRFANACAAQQYHSFAPADAEVHTT